ncbi:MAG: hypothetical protein AAGF74_08750 [Pseudomonadota bacterium]
MIATRMTDRLGVSVPLPSAPMALGSGGDRAWIGTGFRATSDCTEITEAQRREILKSDGTNTRNAFGFVPWPGHVALRTRATPLVDRWLGPEAALAEVAQAEPGHFLSIYDDPETENDPHLFGEAAGFVAATETAAAFAERLVTDCAAHLRTANARMFTGPG